MMENLAIIDVETSGTNPLIHDVLSLAVVPFSVSRRPFSVYISHPNIQWTEYARNNFQRFSAQWHECAVPIDQAVAALENYLASEFLGQEVTPVGHNIAFDLAFMKRLAFQSGREAISKLSHRAVDTHTILYLLYLKNVVPKSALSSDGAFEFFHIKIPPSERHTALGDAKATRDLFQYLLSNFQIQQFAIPSVRSRAV